MSPAARRALMTLSIALAASAFGACSLDASGALSTQSLAGGAGSPPAGATGGTGENCLQLTGDTHRFNDIACSTAHKFLCEYSP
jgi:hypothetical protein